MTALDLLADLEARGVRVSADGKDLAYESPVVGLTQGEIEGLRANKSRLLAVLRLREVHKAMGFSEGDIRFIEKAILSGNVSEIRIVSPVAMGKVVA